LIRRTQNVSLQVLFVLSFAN